MNQQRNNGTTRIWITALLTLILALPVFPGLAGAEETVTSIEFEATPPKLYVDDETYALKVWANLTGGTSTKKEVTSEASWSSTNTAVANVDRSVVTGVSSGYADITAKYKTATVTVRVYVEYLYDKVTISPSANPVSVELGQPLQFELTATKGSVDMTVTSDADWTSSNTSVATVDNGVITLVGAGTVKITAGHKGRTDSVTLDVTSPYKSVAIAPSSMMEFKVGDPAQSLTASAINKNDGVVPITALATWRSGNTAVATVDKGVVTPVGQGTTSITVSHLGALKSITVVVRPSHQAMKISEEKDLHMILSNPAPEIKVTVSVQDDPDTAPVNVTADADWTSSNPYVATVAGGVITPKAVGTAEISAAYKGLTRSVKVIVYPGISHLKIDEKELSGFVGETEDLPKVIGTAITDEELDVSGLVEWTSGDTNILTISNGKWTAKKIGKTSITAKVKNKTASIDVSVQDKPLAVMGTIDDLSLVIGKETPLPKLSIIYENGIEIEDIGAEAVWKASSPNLLIRDGKVKGLIASKGTLTATYLGKSKAFRVTIEDEIIKLTSDSTSILLNPGRTKSVKVTGTYKSGKTVVLTTKMNWKLNSETIASMNGSTVKALTEGTVKLTGTYQEKTVEVTLVVKPKLKKLSLPATSLKLTIGTKESVKLTAEYEGGKIVDVTDSASWTTSNATVATVSKGAITVVGKGTASIKTVFEGKTVTLRVTVK
jgi:hypothetical protein